MPITKKPDKETARINVRLPAEIKARIERAAIVSGVSLTDFTISNLSSSADEVLERYYSTKLTDRDRDIFLTVLDSDGEPEEALTDAFAAHEELISS